MSTSDLDFRPRSFFWPLSLETHVLSTVKGAERRRIINAAIANDDLDLLPAELLSASLSDDDRRSLSRIHPSFMGGEFLPDLQEREIEIARITIDSVTSDVTAVLARQTPQGIAFRVVDEYQGETLTGKTECTSTQPLTLGELIEFFLGAWRLDEVLEMNELWGEDAQSFVNPSSEFYPAFASRIWRLVDTWRTPPEEDDEDELDDGATDAEHGGGQ